MFLSLRQLTTDTPATLRLRMFVVAGLLVVGNVGAWSWAGVAFRRFPVLLGTALLAWSLGLRHAVDADHIAAIDNVTRKFMAEGRRPVSVGLLFSLGHSTVVVVGSMLIAGAAVALAGKMDGMREVGGLIGTLVSTGFLFAIAAVNLVVLRSTWLAFRRVRRGEAYGADELDLLLNGRGLLARVFRPMFRMIRRPWHMYVLGLLFGLGFDTATEVGVLGISAAEASKGLPLWAILVFPVLFAAGMSLIDTADNLLMLGAYGWAFVRPVRKLYYNLTITGVSVLVAVGVGGIEALGLVAEHTHAKGPFWRAVGMLNGNFGVLGYFVVGVFVLSWIVSVAVYQWRGYDELEA